MELVPIFVDEIGGVPEGLYAVRYIEGEPDEFERNFDLWNDIEYLTEFCSQNQDLLSTNFYHYETPLEAVFDIIEEARLFEEGLHKLLEESFGGSGEKLQEVFKPLNNYEYTIPSLQKSKVSWKSRKRKHPKLRIYAIRISPNLYVVTGGGIKLVESMSQSELLKEELRKIEKVKRWLKDHSIEFPEDLNNFSE